MVNTNKKRLVPNALKDEKWKHNPDIKLNMVSYLGFPIVMPDGKPFGTICVLDNKENAYSRTYETQIRNFRDIINAHLELIHMNHVLGEENKSLSDYIKEITALKGLVPICAHCKKIRNDNGGWDGIESYVERHSELGFSHTICPVCAEIHCSQYDLYDE